MSLGPHKEWANRSAWTNVSAQDMDQAPVKTAAREKTFQQELSDVIGRLPDKAIFFVLLAAWLLLFQFFGHCTFNFAKTPSLFEWMFNAYNTEVMDSAHGQVIPVIILVLLWFRRDALCQVIRRVWWPALLLLAGALALHVFGFFAQQPKLSIVALYFGIYALCGLTWGRDLMRACFFPFVLFLFAVPLGAEAEPLTFPMRLLTTQATSWISRDLLDINIVTVGTKILDAHGTAFEVAAACSGIRSLFALLLITLIYAMLSFKSYWRRILIVSLALPLVLICNTIRITAVMLADQAYGPKFAYHVHDWFWIVTYSLSIASLFIAAHWLREAPRKDPS